jgi:uncharacterized protein
MIPAIIIYDERADLQRIFKTESALGEGLNGPASALEPRYTCSVRRFLFTVALMGISRACVLRDLMIGRIGRGGIRDRADVSVEMHSIRSGRNLLDAAFVAPTKRPAQSVVLICHGIGEIVEHWIPAQQLLAANGAASLVFDYSGYGKSTGRPHADQWEEDAIAAFDLLKQLAPEKPVTVLGFSMGSGIAAAIIDRVDREWVQRLVLCAAFTSFRAAAHSIIVPKSLGFLMHDLWHAETALRNCPVPVLIVHGEKDQLFPVQMASELKAWCGCESEIVIVPELRHNEPFHYPDMAYWGLILSRLIPEAQDSEAGAPAIHLD